MRLPKELLLSKIESKNLYKDLLSYERATGRTKPKYKLSHSKILNDYIFHLLTRTKSACKLRLTLAIQRADWENIASEEYLNAECSYCDVTKYDLIDEDELLAKMKSPQNGFPYVARLPDDKFNKIIHLCKEVRHIPHISQETREVFGTLEDLYEEKLEALGLK